MNKCKIILFCLLMMLLLPACTAPARQEVVPTAQATGDVTATQDTTVPPIEATTITSAAKLESETVEIDGVLYRNNFQSNLIFMDPQYDNTPAFEKGYNRYFRMDCEQYDLLYNVNVRDIGVGDSIYCRDDQWQQLYDYYANPENFTYDCWYQEYGAKHVFYPVPDMDVAKLDALVEFCELSSYDPIIPNRGVKTRRVPYAVNREPELRFGKLSKDELFSEGAARFFAWEGKLLLEWYTYSDDYMMVVDVPDDLSQYFIGIVDGLKLD